MTRGWRLVSVVIRCTASSPSLAPLLTAWFPRVRGVFQRRTLTSKEAIYDFTQDWADRVGNLIPNYRRTCGGAPATAFSQGAKFLFNGA